MNPREDPEKALRLLLIREGHYRHTPPDLSFVAVAMTTCPRCGSLPGQVCIVPSGRWASQFTHQQRLTTWFVAQMVGAAIDDSMAGGAT